MKALQLFTICAMTIFTVTVSTSSSALAAPDEVNTEPLVKGNTAFALDLYSTLQKREGNLFFSPYSIATALAMTYGGARGDTRKEMAETLKFTHDQNQLHAAFDRLQSQLNT